MFKQTDPIYIIIYIPTLSSCEYPQRFWPLSTCEMIITSLFFAVAGWFPKINPMKNGEKSRLWKELQNWLLRDMA